MFLLNKIDSLLNGITMYRLALYVLMCLSATAICLGFLKILPYSGFQFITTLTTLLISVYLSNMVFAKIVKADTNVDSYWITGFILFLVLAPISGSTDFFVTTAIAVVAMGSKYFLTFDKKHIFNPAAIGMFLAGLFGFGNSIWWIGSAVMLPFVLISGLLIVRKIRRFRLFFTFIIAAILTITLFNLKNGVNIVDSLIQVFTSWPLIFFGTVMLTEPFTTPPNKKYRTIYGIIVGILFGSQFSFGPLFASPEFALIAGNIYSFIVSPKGKLILKFKERNQLAPTIFEFLFVNSRPFKYLPGQYLEWTLPHQKPDSRGIRRYFTIASAPEEEFVKLGVKIVPEKSSSFKKALLDLKPGSRLTADQLAGDFILPENLDKKLIFIAGGIGVTPFRSMLQSQIKAGIHRETALFYSASNIQEFVYKDIFKKAEDLGVKTVYIYGGKEAAPKNWIGESGYITGDMIKKYAPDFKERIYYLSGPVAMVNNYKKLLGGLGISDGQIVTDYFPGF